MSFNFHPCHREQTLLLPPNLSEWLDEDHVVWFILDSVEEMDLSTFYQSYRADGLGNTAYEPSMMVALYIYAYSKGIRSSRKIEALCEDDVGARFVTGNQKQVNLHRNLRHLRLGVDRRRFIRSRHRILPRGYNQCRILSE